MKVLSSGGDGRKPSKRRRFADRALTVLAVNQALATSGLRERRVDTAEEESEEAGVKVCLSVFCSSRNMQLQLGSEFSLAAVGRIQGIGSRLCCLWMHDGQLPSAGTMAARTDRPRCAKLSVCAFSSETCS